MICLPIHVTHAKGTYLVQWRQRRVETQQLGRLQHVDRGGGDAGMCAEGAVVVGVDENGLG